MTYNGKYFIRSANPYCIIVYRDDDENEEMHITTDKNKKLTCEKLIEGVEKSWYLWIDMEGSNEVLLSDSVSGSLWCVKGGRLIVNKEIKENKGGITQQSAKKIDISNDNIFNVKFYGEENFVNYFSTSQGNVVLKDNGDIRIENNGKEGLLVEWMTNDFSYTLYPGNLNNSNNCENCIQIDNSYFEIEKSICNFHIKNLEKYFEVSNKEVILNKNYSTQEKQLWYFIKDNFNRVILCNTGGSCISVDNRSESAIPVKVVEYKNIVTTNNILSVEKTDLYSFNIRLVYNKNSDWIISGISDGNDKVYYDKPKEKMTQILSLCRNESTGIEINEKLFMISEDLVINPIITYLGSDKCCERVSMPSGKKIELKYETSKNTYSLTKSYFNQVYNSVNSDMDNEKTISFDDEPVLKYIIGPINEHKNDFTNLKLLEFTFEPGNKVNWSKLIFSDYNNFDNKDQYKLLNVFKYLGSRSFKENDYIVNIMNTAFTELLSNLYSSANKDNTKINMLECLGWNRYRPSVEKMKDELAYFNFKFSEFVDVVLSSHIYDKKSNLSDKCKELFIVNGKLLNYVLYTNLFDQIVKVFGGEFLNHVPTLKIGEGSNEYLPYWNNNEGYFATTGSDTNQNIYWSINNGSNSKYDVRTGSEDSNIIRKDSGKTYIYNDVFAVYGCCKKLTYKLQNINSTTNPDDFKNSMTKLQGNTKSLIASAIVSDNYQPFTITPDDYIGDKLEDKYKFTIPDYKNDSESYNGYKIGTRFSGCQIGESKTTTYDMVLAVTEIGKLTNEGGKAVDCGPAGADSGGDDCHIGPITSYYNFPKRIALFIYNDTGKCVSYKEDIGKSYYLEYLKYYSGFGKWCYDKNGKGGRGKCRKSGASRYPGTHPWIHWCTRAFDPSGGNTVSTSDDFLKCNLKYLDNETSLKIDDKTYTIDNSAIRDELNGKWGTIESAGLIYPHRIDIRRKCTYDIYVNDDAWIRVKNKDDKTYLTPLFNSDNHDKTYKLINDLNNEITCYGSSITIRNIAQEISIAKYSGNDKIDSGCKEDSKRETDDKIYTDDPTNPKARCFVKTDNKTIRLFDERVDKLIIDTINNNIDTLTNRLEDEIIDYFANNPLQLLPYRLLHKYIPSLCINENKTKSNIENVIGPVLFNIPSPLLTDYKYYIAGYYDDFKTMLLKSIYSSDNKENEGTYEINGISNVSMNSTHYIDNMIVEIGSNLSNIDDFNDKVLVLSLKCGISTIYQYIGENNSAKMYTINTYDIGDELEKYLTEGTMEQIGILISQNKINGYSEKITIIGTISTPGIICHQQQYEEYSNMKFSYGMNKYYVYRTKHVLSLTSDGDVLLVGGNKNNEVVKEEASTNTDYQACVIDVGVGDGLKSVSNWLKPYWYPSYNFTKNSK